MKISRDAIHDSLVATYQSLEASILNRVLVENGITDAVLREAIVGDFLYEQGVILDQSWFSEQDQQWYSGVFFSTKPHEEIDSSTVHLPSEQYGMNFHEYAQGAAEWAIENESIADAIVVGNT